MQNTMEQMKSTQGAQYEISVDGVPRTYRDARTSPFKPRGY
jgi:hypothetical protein